MTVELLLIVGLAAALVITNLCWRSDVEAYKEQLADARHELTKLRASTNVRDDVRFENLKIAYNARVEALIEECLGELAAKDAVIDSWKARCFQIKAEAGR